MNTSILCSNGFRCRLDECKFWSKERNECLLVLSAKRCAGIVEMQSKIEIVEVQKPISKIEVIEPKPEKKPVKKSRK